MPDHSHPEPHTDSRENQPVAWLCATCGSQHAPSLRPPEACAVCEDERQYVGWQGQAWLTPKELRARYRIVFEEEDGVMTLRTDPGFAISQRAFLIPHGDGHLMWECLSPVTDEAVARIKAMGGLTGIAISHPHFYAAMVDWSDALDGVPIHIHAADREWVKRPSPNLHFWDGARHALADNLSLIHLGGHFAGSAGLWWQDGPRAGGSLFSGDAIQVAVDRRFASFMYSYPNMIPLGPTALARLRARVAPLVFEDLFGYARGRQIIGDAKARVEASFDRYQAAITR